MTACQLYQYNSTECHLKEGDEAFFAASFSTLLEPDKVAWLNYHKTTDTDNISKLFESLQIERFLLEDIQSDFSRAKIEEFDNYLFF